MPLDTGTDSARGCARWGRLHPSPAVWYVGSTSSTVVSVGQLSVSEARMGRAHCLVHEDIRGRLYTVAAQRSDDLYILDDKPHGEGLHLMEVISEHLPPGYQGQQSVILTQDLFDGDKVSFKKDADV